MGQIKTAVLMEVSKNGKPSQAPRTGNQARDRARVSSETTW